MANDIEAIRNYHRKEGADAVVQRIIRNLQLDAVISTNVDVRFLERLVDIIEASNEPPYR